MYAENTGVGSRVSPCEMMIPRGSFDDFALVSFFIIQWEAERAPSPARYRIKHSLYPIGRLRQVFVSQRLTKPGAGLMAQKRFVLTLGYCYTVSK